MPTGTLYSGQRATPSPLSESDGLALGVSAANDLFGFGAAGGDVIYRRGATHAPGTASPPASHCSPSVRSLIPA